MVNQTDLHHVPAEQLLLALCDIYQQQLAALQEQVNDLRTDIDHVRTTTDPLKQIFAQTNTSTHKLLFNHITKLRNDLDRQTLRLQTTMTTQLQTIETRLQDLEATVSAPAQ